MYSTNVFLSDEESPQDAVVASLIALNLDPNQNVKTDSQGKLISEGSHILPYKIHEINEVSGLIALQAYFQRFQVGASTTISDIRVYLGLNGDEDIRFAIYEQKGGQQKLVETTVQHTGNNVFQDFALPTPVNLSQGQYWMGVSGSGTGLNVWELGKGGEVTTTELQQRDIFYTGADYHLGFPANLPAAGVGTGIPRGIWFQLIV